MVKKAYEKPLAKLVKLRSARLICTSPLRSVNMNRNVVMDVDEEFE